MLAVGLTVVGIAIAAGFALVAFEEDMMFFRSVTQVVAGEYPEDRNFRVGGLVVDGSIHRDEGSLDVNFLVTDMRCEVEVVYTGVLPDLFREGQGVVAHGRMNGDVFVADEVLAKHDENYMAPEVSDSLAAKHVEGKSVALNGEELECNVL
jgi:cytochrome c-type biogenesis protein CcmE